MNTNEHWNKIYASKDDCELGWYERDLSYSLSQVKKIDLTPGSNVLIVGAGRSKIVDYFISIKCKVIVNDISDVAIEKMKLEYIDNQNIEYIIGDISDVVVGYDGNIDLWFDRAVLHFILDDDKVNKYFNNCRRSIKAGGYAIFSEFAKDGAEKCADLMLRRYDKNELLHHMENFSVTNCENSVYINPFGQERKYINCIFRKTAQQGDAPESASSAR